MAGDKSHQDAFLAAIEAKIAAWTAVADTYRAAVSLDSPLGDRGAVLSGVMASAGAGNVQARSQTDLPVGVFRDKSLKEAIPIYLSAGRRKQTNKEITNGLQAGGFPTTAENFEATVATALYRLKHDGMILRFPDGWDLASSYPDNLRGRLEKDAKPKRTKSSKGKAKKRSRVSPVKAARAKTQTITAAPPLAQPGAGEGNKTTAVMSALVARATTGATVAELYAGLQQAGFAGKKNYVFNVLSRLHQIGKVEKQANGRWYPVARAAA